VVEKITKKKTRQHSDESFKINLNPNPMQIYKHQINVTNKILMILIIAQQEKRLKS
jgi:hypothetical protein